MLSCRAWLPLPRQTLNFAAGIIRRHRISIGSLRRKLNRRQQALLVLVYLRKGETFASLARTAATRSMVRMAQSRCAPAMHKYAGHIYARFEAYQDYGHRIGCRRPLPAYEFPKDHERIADQAKQCRSREGRR